MTKQTTNQLQVVHQTLESLLKQKAGALPKNFNQTRFLQNTMTVLMDVENIQKMEPKSVARTMLKGAFLGLDFFNKECYAIPYGNSLNFQTDYKGEIKLAKKYSLYPIRDIYAKLVREGDVFSETIIDGKQTIDFHPKPFNDGAIIGCFAVCYYKDGSMLYETMSVDEMENVKKVYSRTDKNGKYSKAWRESTGEMYKKTVLRRLTKLIQLDFENADQDQSWEDGSDAKFNGAVETEYEPIEMPQIIGESNEAENQSKDKAEIPSSANARDDSTANDSAGHTKVPNKGDRPAEGKSERIPENVIGELKNRVIVVMPKLKAYGITTITGFLKNYGLQDWDNIPGSVFEEMKRFVKDVETGVDQSYAE